MKKIVILIFCLALTTLLAQNSQIDVSGTSSIYLVENNTICSNEISVGQNASFTAEFYGDVYDGDCATTLTPTGDGTITLPVEINDIETLPSVFTLKSAYPNPFNPNTIIQYSIPNSREVTVNIYDVRGRKIATLFNSLQEPGWYEITWNGLLNNGSLASAGVYLYKVTADSEIKTGKISLIK